MRPVALYAYGAWVTTKTDENRLVTFERKIFRKIFGPKWNTQGDFELRTKREIEELYGETNIIGAEDWNGVGMCRDPKALLVWLQIGNQTQKDRRDDPDSIGKDVLRLEVNNGEQLAQDRGWWRQVVIATMELNGP